MFSTSGARRHRRRRAHSTRAMLLFFMIAFSLLTPLTSTIATAETQEPDQSPSTEVPLTGDEQESADSDSGDEPAATEEPTEVPDDPEYFTIDIDKWSCDNPSLDPATSSYQDYKVSCLDGMVTTFTASDGLGYQESQTTSSANFNTPVELITVNETIPAGYGEPVVFCAWTENGQTSSHTLHPTSGGTTQFQGKSDEFVSCQWFNIELPDTSPSDLIIYTWECPAGYDETLPMADPILDCTMLQNGVTFTLDHPDPAATDLSSMTGDAIDGAVMFGGIDPGPYTIVEALPDGWDHGFLWECTDSQDNYLVSMASGEVHAIEIPAGEEVHCRWFNVPMAPEPVHYADLTIYLWECPAGYDRSAPGADPWTDCPTSVDGIEFTLSDNDPNTANEVATSGTPSTGVAYFPNLAVGTHTVTETIPAGTAYVFIDHCIGLIDGQMRTYPLMTSSFDFGVVGNDGHITCHWYNVPLGDPEPVDIFVYKFTCAPGYDVSDPASDPINDCPQTTNGVNFTLTDGDPATVDLMTMTGDAIDGAVMFGGTEPGTYTIIETVPAGTASVFVLDCYGLMDGVQRPSPISTQPSLDFEVTGYEGTITCYWFNVPEDPHGSLTVIKYACWTEEFVSEVDCEVYEDGQTFSLYAWNGSDWSIVGTLTTGPTGTITWSGLAGGSYVLDEHDGEPCHITASFQDGSDHILVVEGEKTVVRVFNCGHPQTWETPAKYPNTGVLPSMGETPSFTGHLSQGR